MSKLKCLVVVLAGLLTGCASLSKETPSAQALALAQTNTRHALLLLEQDQPATALAYVQEARQQAPNFAPAHNVAGLVYAQLERLDRAEQAFQETLTLAPDDPAALNNYGTFLCNQGQYAKAERHFLKAAANPRNPQPEIAYTNAGLCVLRIPNLDHAAQYFQAALDANPRLPNAQFQLAQVSLERGQPAQAARELEHYLEFAPHTPQTLWLGIQIEADQGNVVQRDHYVQLLQTQFPTSTEAKRLVEEGLPTARTPPRPARQGSAGPNAANLRPARPALESRYSKAQSAVEAPRPVYGEKDAPRQAAQQTFSQPRQRVPVAPVTAAVQQTASAGLIIRKDGAALSEAAPSANPVGAESHIAQSPPLLRRSGCRSSPASAAGPSRRRFRASIGAFPFLRCPRPAPGAV